MPPRHEVGEQAKLYVSSVPASDATVYQLHVQATSPSRKTPQKTVFYSLVFVLRMAQL
jgi:hypothetical protein